MPMGTLAKQHGGERTLDFDQGTGLDKNWRELYPESRDGVCGGLSLIWLASKKHGMSSTVFEAKYDASLFKFAEHAAELGGDNTMGGQVGIDAVAAQFGLVRSSALVTVSNTSVAKWISNGPAPYVFIGLDGHAVAAATDGSKVTFFDPNYGEFAFSDGGKFSSFLTAFLRKLHQNANFLKFYA